MIIIAIAVYLPEHVTTIFSRAWFYYAGDDSGSLQSQSAVGGRNVAGSNGFAGKPMQHQALASKEQEVLGTLGNI